MCGNVEFAIRFDVFRQCLREYGRLLYRLSETCYAVGHKHFTCNISNGGRFDGNLVYAIRCNFTCRPEVDFRRCVLSNKRHLIQLFRDRRNTFATHNFCGPIYDNRTTKRHSDTTQSKNLYFNLMGYVFGNRSAADIWLGQV